MTIRAFVRSLLCDILAAGVILCCFALWHHVIPRPLTPSQMTSDAVNAVPADPNDWSSRFAEHFLTFEQTQTSYRSRQISIQVEQRSLSDGDTVIPYHFVDVYLSDIRSLSACLSHSAKGRSELKDMAAENKAVFAATGDFFGNSVANKFVIRNGEALYDAPASSDICILYLDGTMHMVPPGTLTDEVRAAHGGIWQAWTFGPILLDGEGRAVRNFNTSSALLTPNRRIAIGYFEPGHYGFVAVDYEETDELPGATMQQLSRICEEIGFSSAYNLDGGKSAVMIFDGKYLNRPYIEKGTTDITRPVSDGIIIREVEG